MSDKKNSRDEQQKQNESGEEVFDLSAYDDADAETNAGAGAASSAETAKLTAALEKAEKDYLYLRADFDNYKKSAIKERSELIKYGNERLVTELLNLLDTFEQALSIEITPENVQSFKEGVELLQNEFSNVLGRFGVTPVDSLGKAFDPMMHEALSAEPTNAYQPGHISKVFKKAYKLHDKLIRPAQVVVAKEPDEQSS